METTLLGLKSSRIQASAVGLNAYYIRDIAPDERPKVNWPALGDCRKDHGWPRGDCDGVAASMNEVRFALADCLRAFRPGDGSSEVARRRIWFQFP